MEDRQLVPWAPPLILPTTGYKDIEHLELMVRAYLKVRIQTQTIEIWRIDLTRNEVLISTPGGEAYTVLIPTEDKPQVPIEIIKGWPVERRAVKRVIRHP